MTRAEWEKDHKPTCDRYPCSQWQEIHWHISKKALEIMAGSKNQ